VGSGAPELNFAGMPPYRERNAPPHPWLKNAT
jgi:hypothetical protein